MVMRPDFILRRPPHCMLRQTAVLTKIAMYTIRFRAGQRGNMRALLRLRLFRVCCGRSVCVLLGHVPQEVVFLVCLATVC